jgi:formate-dependent nitrite reductase cytochrome c552 subunit
MHLRYSALALLAATGLSTAAHAQAAAGYVGSESCKTCHEAAYETWLAGPHARATASLTGKAANDGRCLSCHAPEQAKAVAAVGCEICHGPGQYYAPTYVMKDPELARLVGLEDPGEKSCRVCHDASSPSLRPFDYKAKLPLIDHWTAETQKREAARLNRRFLEQALGLAVEPPAGSETPRMPARRAAEIRTARR